MRIRLRENPDVVGTLHWVPKTKHWHITIGGNSGPLVRECFLFVEADIGGRWCYPSKNKLEILKKVDYENHIS